jgi:hypothetical protein
MEKKKLLKCALTAFAISSALPVAADLAELNQSGTFLAAGCGSCSSARRNVSYNDSTPGYQSSRPVSQGSCGASRPSSSQSSCGASRPSSSQSSCGASRPSGSQAGCGAHSHSSPTYSYSYDAPRNTVSPSNNFNQPEITTNRSYSQSPSRSNNYPNYLSDGYETTQTVAAPATRSWESVSDEDLNRQLSSQGRAIYQTLDSEGKTLARQLASQDSYKDKDLAIKEAQRRSNEKRGITGSVTISPDGSSNWNR